MGTPSALFWARLNCVKPASTDLILTGRTESHLVPVVGSAHRVHAQVAAPFMRLKLAARKAGFELEIVSGFRGFDAQLGIWNQKAQGKRPLLDGQSKPLDAKTLQPREIAYAILNWSALPGLSRHHWGTDIDVIDRKSVPEGYKIQLTPEEVSPQGIFGPLHEWLDENMEEEGFFRPYQKDFGGVKPERWHLSYAPLAEELFRTHRVELVRETLVNTAIDLKDAVLAELPQIFDRFFQRVSHASGN